MDEKIEESENNSLVSDMIPQLREVRKTLKDYVDAKLEPNPEKRNKNSNMVQEYDISIYNKVEREKLTKYIKSWE